MCACIVWDMYLCMWHMCVCVRGVCCYCVNGVVCVDRCSFMCVQVHVHMRAGMCREVRG